MKKGFPDKQEWNKIVEEAFSSDDKHDFSAHYELRKDRMQRGIRMTKNTDRKGKKIVAAVIASAAAIALIPTSVYAYNRIKADISKTADYQTTISISTPEQIADESGDQFMFYTFNWLPDGYVKAEDPYTYINEDTNGKIGAQFYDLPKGTDISIDLPFSENCETYESGDKTAMINYRAPNIYDMTIHHDNSEQPGYSRNIFVTFGETSYLAEINISDDVSDEDLRNLIDNMELIPTEKKMYGDYIPFLDPDNNSTSNDEPPLQDAVNMNVVHVGDTVYYDNEEYFGGFSFTLNSAEFIDNFDGINTDACGNYADYSQYMDENGNIIENIRSIIEFGDGVNSNDKVLSEESIPMHILKIKATFTNTRDVENEIGIDPTMFAIQDGKPVNQAFVNYNGQRYIDSVSGVSGSMDFFSMDTAPEKKGSKNAVYLAPGESAEVQLAFWVPDDLKDEVYFMQRLGNAYDTEINRGSPVFDLRASTIG